MLAEVISIGDELTSGVRLDTNSQWLSQRLGEIGVAVGYHTTVADDLAANVRVFREAFDRADVIVATGGLGPTADDLTREAAAQALGVELVLDEGSLAHIQALFARRSRPMPERNVLQAYLPRGARPIPNPHGTAPGIDAEKPRPDRSPARLFALPGVPAEMREMWTASVAPAICGWLGPERRLIAHRRLKCFGVGESDLEALLPDLIRRGRDPSVGITVSKATITLRVTAHGADEAECAARMAPTLATIRECLGELVFGEEDEELQHAVLRLLGERGQTLAVSECGTGGLLANWLSELDPEGRTFLGGRILRAARLAEADDAAPLAAACRADFAADFALGVGRLPRPEAAAREGAVSLALASAGGVEVLRSKTAAHPDILLARTAKQALNLLRLHLLRGAAEER